MKEEYIRINKSQIKKRIEELEKETDETNGSHEYVLKCEAQVGILKEILSQSTPLIPENIKPLQELVDEGYDAYNSSHHLQVQRMLKVIQDYILNLKLDI